MKNEKHTSQKGITLIALIITIIVMLILVGVTINIALNGGVFEKADKARRETQLAMDKEELQEELVIAYDEDDKGVNLETLKENLVKRGWTDITISEDGLTLTCTSPKGNTFTVDGTGKVTDVPKNDDDDDDDDKDIIIGAEEENDLESYLFTKEDLDEDGNVDGKTGLLTMDENTEAITFVDDPNTIADASTSIIYMNNGSENGEYYVVFEYKGADYKVDVTGFDFATATATVGSDEEKVTKLPTIYDGDDDETKIKQYFLGYSGTGKYFMSTVDIELSEQKQTTVFKNNEIIPNASESITLLAGSGTAGSIEYNGNTYVITINSSSMTIQSVTAIEPKTYPAVYSGDIIDLGIKVLLIEISETEAIHYVYNESSEKARKDQIYPCSNLNSIPGYEDYAMNNNGIIYTKLCSDSYTPSGYVYSELFDKWYSCGYASINGSNSISVTSEVDLSRDKTISQEEINRIIELANTTNE